MEKLGLNFVCVEMTLRLWGNQNWKAYLRLRNLLGECFVCVEDPDMLVQQHAVILLHKALIDCNVGRQLLQRQTTAP
jgi:hypothetical protein